MSGDIELNPGPVQNDNRHMAITLPSNRLLELRLHQLGLRPLDVGGAGDCFFRAVSHQLHGDQNFHLNIRAAGIEYMNDNPERFIESNTENSWVEYLTNMSRQGTWSDGLIIQAVADKLNLRIHIVESHQHFAEFNVVEATSPLQEPRVIYLGHVDEYHYVSTLPLSFGSNALENESLPVINGKRNAYMREYMKRKRKTDNNQKYNVYMREYKKRKRSEQKKQKAEKEHSINVHVNATDLEDNGLQHDNQIQQTESAYEKNLISNFHDIVSKGPLYICSCCDQLWYKHSVSSAQTLRHVNPHIDKYLLNKKSVKNVEWLCRSCHKYLAKSKVPPCAAVNGMQFPTKPAFFDLNELECRLLAPRLAFQKLMQAPRGKQFKISGNIVNVPADITNTVSMLPRLPDETGTIKVNLKRRLQYKSSALSLNVRPHKVMQAANWIVNNSSLYREEGIMLNQNWSENNGNLHECNVEEHEDQSQDIDCDTLNVGKTNEMLNDEDEWSEIEAEIPAGVCDTMLTATNFMDDSERQDILNVAPAEGNRPLSVFRDKYSEELAYPGIFLGQKRPDNENRLAAVHYSDICKSELRRSDRRAAMCMENIFFKTKKLQMKIMLGKSQVALRKCKGNNRTVKAGELKCPGALEKLIHHDEGFKFLRALRGSPPYFEKAKKDIFAMIRQLGPASLFCSFSSAETQWPHLLRILGKLVDNKEYTDTELENLNWQEKCRLIQSDPVTCARHFDYQVSQFLRNFLMSSLAPLGKIADWFYRVEYQQRGSPHIHMLIWLEDAPVFGVDSDDKVIAFIDKIIKCERPTNNPELLTLVNRQIHRHSHTCRKKSKTECRFQLPTATYEFYKNSLSSG